MGDRVKPTFTIVESDYNHMDKFDDFEKDFLDNMNVRDLCKKYEIPRRVWLEWKIILKEKHPNLQRWTNKGRPLKKKEYSHVPLGERTIFRTPNGNYTVFRRVKNKGRMSYGTYRSRKRAEYVLSELRKYKWNKYVAFDLIQRYAIRNSRNYLLANVLERDL